MTICDFYLPIKVIYICFFSTKDEYCYKADISEISKIIIIIISCQQVLRNPVSKLQKWNINTDNNPL